MIRCALAEIRSALVSTPRRRSSSSSSVSTRGSITTPLPITHGLPGCRIPEGIRCSFQASPLRTIVCPALLPPWKRTTTSARSASRSVTLPLPSSPHWAPTNTIPGIGDGVYARHGRTRAGLDESTRLSRQVSAAVAGVPSPPTPGPDPSPPTPGPDPSPPTPGPGTPTPGPDPAPPAPDPSPPAPTPDPSPLPP